MTDLSLVEQIAERRRSSEICKLYRDLRLSEVEIRDPELGLYVYAEVSPATVASEVRKAADAAVRWCVNDMLLPSTPSVVWFTPETDADRAFAVKWGRRDWNWQTTRQSARGLTQVLDRSEIWIRATLGPSLAALTAAHECRHIAQPAGMADGEADALEYETRKRKELLRDCL